MPSVLSGRAAQHTDTGLFSAVLLCSFMCLSSLNPPGVDIPLLNTHTVTAKLVGYGEVHIVLQRESPSVLQAQVASVTV